LFPSQEEIIDKISFGEMEKVACILHGGDIFLTKKIFVEKRMKLLKKIIPILWEGNTALKT
jgi:hypothetical protein